MNIKYYLIVVIDYNDGTKSAKSIYEYDNLNTARANFHKQFGGWMEKENVSHVLAIVTDSNGMCSSIETYTKPFVEETAVSEEA